MKKAVEPRLAFAVGKRFRTRGGAVVRVIRVANEFPAYPFVVAVFERLNDGTQAAPGTKVSFCPAGNYWNLGPHELDLIAEIASATGLAA